MVGASPRASRTDARERLIAAAVKVVAREGLEAASVKTIAAEAGLTPGLLHYHFASKDALLEAALREALQTYLERVRSRRLATPADRQLEALFDDARAAVTRDADFFRTRLAFAAKALADPKLAAVMGQLNAAAIEETALTLAAAQNRSTASAADLAQAAVIKAVYDGLMLAWLLDPAFPLAAAEAALRKAFAP